jgi:hypothetical protein
MDAIETIRTGMDFTVDANLRRELEQKIAAAFYADLFKLPPPQGTPMSATEAQQRWEETHRRLSPTVGRLESEFLSVLLDRAFGILFRAGVFPELTEALAQFPDEDRRNIDVEYQGPLARAQKAGDLAAVQRTYASILPIAEAVPEVLDVIDHDEAARYVADVAGAPKRIIRDARAVKQIREARAKAAAQKQQMEDAMVMAQAAKAGGGAIASLAQAEAAAQQNGRPAA